MKRAYSWTAILLAMLCLLLAPSSAWATSGLLKSDSVKTCPNGTTYGQHGNGHWHVAVRQRSGGRYQASGGEIASDPCPGYTVNQGTAASTNVSAPQQSAPQTPAQNITPTPQTQPTPTVTQPATTTSAPQAAPVNNAEASSESNSGAASSSKNDSEKKGDDKDEEPKTKTVTQKFPSVDIRLYDRNIGDKPVKFKDNKYESSQTPNREYFVYKIKATSGANVRLERNGKEVKSPVKLNYGDNDFTLVVNDKHDHTNKYKITINRSTVEQEIGAIAFFVAIWIIIAVYYKMPRWGSMNVAMKVYTVFCITFALGVLGMIFSSPEKDFSNVELKSGEPSITIKYPDKKRKIQVDGISIENADGQSDNERSKTQRGGSSSQNGVSAASQNVGSSSVNVRPGGSMSGIAIAEAASVGYSRSDYQPNWSVGSGCDIRSRMLTSSSTVGVQYGRNGCTVTYGSWVDPYTGAVETGNPYRGDGTANDMDIDHIIPLHYVNNHGGSSWPASKKRQYGASLEAMNQGVYVAVSASANRKKSDKGPSQYYPTNGAYRCEYARKWRDIARLYGISLSNADYNVIRNTLASCGISFDFRVSPMLAKLA